MFRRSMVLFGAMAVLAMANVASAQLFPNAFWNKQPQAASTNCPNGNCPLQTVAVPGSSQPGHWSFPGSLDNHLEGVHGVATAGMTRQQKLDLHDSLHEGTASPASVPYRAASYATSAPVAIKSGGSSGGGSSGSLRVGTVLPDGSVVSSVGSTLDPAIAKASEAGIQALGISDRVQFRRSLIAAARKAKESGEISAMEFFALSAASRNPRVLEKMQEALHEAAIEEGLATTAAIDWNGLIEFMEKLIPIIIKLIDLFS